MSIDFNSSFTNLLLPEEWEIVQTILLHLNWIALLCSLLEVLTYLLFKREFPRSMPLQLGLVTCILHAALLIGPIVGYNGLATPPHAPPNPYCFVQATAIQFSSMGTGCWLLNISIHLYVTCVRKWGAQKVRTLIPFIHIFGWIFPLLTTMPPLIMNKISRRGSWCWISPDHNGVWEFACFYAPMMIILAITSVLWVSVLTSVCKISTQFKTMSYIVQSVLIVFLLSLGYAVQCAHRIINLLEKDNFLLEAVHTVSLSTIGIVVFFVYGVNYDNIQLYKRNFRKCCCETKGYEELYRDNMSNDKNVYSRS